jgi:CheY-like chemotaxis protein
VHAEQIVRNDARAKQIKLHFELTAQAYYVMADSGRLHQVFWNILKNAIKFTPAGEEVAVRTTNPEIGEIRLEFIDTGIGIEPQFLDSVFEAFEQGDGLPRSASNGLGLGMSISKTIIEQHEGTISVTSAGAGQGTTFTVELATMVARLGGTVSSPRAQSASPRVYRLLLVEDHQATLESLGRLLRQQGHEVVTASTVEAARSFAANHEFDLVISDIGLPDGNGVDLMSELTRDYGLRGIALSGYGMDEDLARSSNAGFIAHLVKPIDVDRLYRVLEQAAPVA